MTKKYKKYNYKVVLKMVRRTIRSLLWYAKNPQFYEEFFNLLFSQIKNLLNPFYNPKKEKELARNWCREKAVDTKTALFKITGLSGFQDFEKKFAKQMRISKKIAENCPAKMGGAGNLNLVYYLTEYLQVTKIIETGVAYGWSSLAILLSLKNREGSLLISTDKPYPGRNNEKYVGCVVPLELKQNWKIIKYADRKAVPRAIKITEGVDLCHYDSDKNYEGRMRTYPLLWKALRKGGVFISDDIADNLAFCDFYKSLNMDSLVVEESEKYVGVLVKEPSV